MSGSRLLAMAYVLSQSAAGIMTSGKAVSARAMCFTLGCIAADILHGGLQLLVTAGHVYTGKAGARHEC
jgi:hypothetical protein